MIRHSLKQLAKRFGRSIVLAASRPGKRGSALLAVVLAFLAHDSAIASEINSLNWLAGHWSSQRGERISEESWSAPAGGMMLGTNRSIQPNRAASYEFLRIAESGDGISYFASPGGAKPTAFELIEHEPNKRVVFENLKHDFPQRIIYSLADNVLTARIEGTINGEQRSMQWRWQRTSAAVPAEQANAAHAHMLGLRTAIYKVKDLDAAKAWYAKAFAVQPYFDEPFYVGFNVGGYELGLDPNVESVVYGTNQPVYWGVRNCEVSHKRLVSLGAESVDAPTDVGDGILVATVKDPFGNILGIIENPKFEGASEPQQ